MIRTEHMIAFQVPAFDADFPAEEQAEVADWLATYPYDWDGDVNGVSLYLPTLDDHFLASPGDWIVQLLLGDQWVIIPAAARVLSTALATEAAQEKFLAESSSKGK